MLLHGWHGCQNHGYLVLYLDVLAEELDAYKSGLLMKYLLDTNICIYLIKNHPPQVLENFRTHSLPEVAISTITVFELEYGVAKSQQQLRSEAALTKFLQPLNIVRLNHDSARKAAGIRAMLEKKETPIGSSDLLIAGIALSHDLILVTNNVREFRRVEGLTIENWI